MASTNQEEERLKAEIAKLTGAIQTHKQQHQYAPRGRGGYGAVGGAKYRGAYGRGGFAARGRGRGAVAAPARNRTLILNDASKNAGPSSSASTSTTANDTSTPDTPSNSNTDGWIKRKTTHNMSLVSTSTFKRTEPRRLAALEAKRKAAAAAASSSSAASGRKTRKSTNKSVRRGDNMGEVVIDGVVFEFDPSGTKLVKKPVQPSTSSSSSTPQPTPSTSASTPAAVPLKTSINGQDYIRTKRGNLISTSLLAKRKAQREASAKMSRLDKMVGQISAIQSTRNAASRSKTLDVKKAATLCTFFSKTGQCKRGLSCPFVHDSSKLALCPRVLRPGGCRLAKGTCALSHTVKPERVPHCVHYLRSAKCRNGEECLYTHAELAEGERTRICRSFSDYGWCERGKQCEERHTFECPDFVERGKCERKGCKLVHVIRAQEADAGEVGDEQLFMRDDIAATEDADETEKKRKRPLMETEVEPVLPQDEEEDEQVDFTNADESRGAKRRKAKAFTQQRDFISFDDEDDDAEESGDEDEVSADEDEVDDEDVASVHSEDFELSDGEAEEEEGEDAEDAAEEEGEEENDETHEDEQDENEDDDAQPPIHQSQEEASDDDDDDLVDRDL